MTTKALEASKQPVIVQYLTKFKDQIAAALPKHLTADRMARIVTTEVRKTPQLLQCNPKSLFGAVIQASQLGLEPGSALGHCYLIPFKKDVTLIIGYRGMLDLARRSGNIISISARCVYAMDEFSFAYGLNETLEHTPSTDVDRGNLTHVYAVAKLRDSGVQWEVMNKNEIEAIRKQSKAGSSGPWKTHFDEMAKKTVIRRLFKYLPVSIEAQSAVGLDEQADAGISQRNDAVIEGNFMELDDTSPEPTTRTEAVKEKLAVEKPKRRATYKKKEPEQKPETATQAEAQAATDAEPEKTTDQPDTSLQALSRCRTEMIACTTFDDLDLAKDNYREVITNPAHLAAAKDHYLACMRKLEGKE